MNETHITNFLHIDIFQKNMTVASADPGTWPRIDTMPGSGTDRYFSVRKVRLPLAGDRYSRLLQHQTLQVPCYLPR